MERPSCFLPISCLDLSLFLIIHIFFPHHAYYDSKLRIPLAQFLCEHSSRRRYIPEKPSNVTLLKKGQNGPSLFYSVLMGLSQLSKEQYTLKYWTWPLVPTCLHDLLQSANQLQVLLCSVTLVVFYLPPSCHKWLSHSFLWGLHNHFRFWVQ